MVHLILRVGRMEARIIKHVCTDSFKNQQSPQWRGAELSVLIVPLVYIVRVRGELAGVRQGNPGCVGWIEAVFNVACVCWCEKP